MRWVYAENDRFFGPDLAARMVAGFRKGGGNVTFVATQAYGSDGHDLFSQGGQPIWEPIVDAFLKARGFSTAHRVPALGPVDTLEAPREVGAGGRRDFETYRASASHKAFAIGATGAYAWRTARDTAAEAAAAALARCEAAGGQPCRLYAIDDAYAPK